jgi:alpha-tubulin suppressor-like RCC1 family protein
VSVSAKCTLRTDGTAWCWGGAFLGDGTNNSSADPVQIVSLGSNVSEVSAEGLVASVGGTGHTCARKADGSLWCWGFNTQGEIGDGTLDFLKPAPVEVGSLGSAVMEVALGNLHTCAIKTDGTLWCWGYNHGGQLGDQTTDGPKPLPVQVAGLGSNVARVAAGYGHTCAVKTDGTLWCWGANHAGQAGDGTTDGPKLSPVQVLTLGSTVVEVVAAGEHSCAIKGDGTLWCWGDLAESNVPVQIASLGTSVVQVATSQSTVCAIKGDGSLWCWQSKGEPELVTPLGSNVAQVALGWNSLCAAKTNGALWCADWPFGDEGQIGDLVQIALPCP